MTGSQRTPTGYPIRYSKANDYLLSFGYGFPMETDELGQRIKAARTLRGWTQEELAQKVSGLINRVPPYGKAAVQKWESGTTEMPPGDVIWALERILSIPYDLLLWGQDRKPAGRAPRPPRGRKSSV